MVNFVGSQAEASPVFTIIPALGKNIAYCSTLEGATLKSLAITEDQVVHVSFDDNEDTLHYDGHDRNANLTEDENVVTIVKSAEMQPERGVVDENTPANQPTPGLADNGLPNLQAAESEGETEDASANIQTPDEAGIAEDVSANAQTREGREKQEDTLAYLSLEQRRLKFLGQLEGSQDLQISRSNILSEMIKLYTDNSNILEKRLCVQFKGELGADESGLTKELFSLFWEECFLQYFEGESQSVPRVDPDLPVDKFVAMGKILLHGFLLVGFLPLQMAQVCMMKILLGSQAEVPQGLIETTFQRFLSDSDVAFLNKASSSLKDVIDNERQSRRLMSFLSRYGSRVVPKTNSDLESLIADIGRCVLVERPTHALICIGQGLASAFKPLWAGATVQEVQTLYQKMEPTTDSLLDIIIPKADMTSEEEQAHEWLERFVQDADQNLLKTFVRYVTASSVLLPNAVISIEFNSPRQSEMKFAATTCTNTLHVPTTFRTYSQFKSLMLLTLNSPYTWDFNCL